MYQFLLAQWIGLSHTWAFLSTCSIQGQTLARVLYLERKKIVNKYISN